MLHWCDYGGAVSRTIIFTRTIDGLYWGGGWLLEYFLSAAWVGLTTVKSKLGGICVRGCCCMGSVATLDFAG